MNAVNAVIAPASELAELLEVELCGLDRGVPRAVWERVLVGPARDLLCRPAKQFRAQLLETGWALADGRGAPPASLLAAIEVLHAGSLVIDDIEDEAELRRGDVALHRRYGLPIALNTGNWMYFLAFALVDRTPVSDATRLALHRAMLHGVLDCHAGQALDVGQDVTAVPRDQLRALVSRATSLKSGSLTRLAAELGAIAAGGEPARLDAIGRFGAALGLGLQMLDDASTITADRPAKLREDLVLLRPTWPWVWAAETADETGWQRLVMIARQVAARRDDPLPLARLLARHASAGRAEAAQQLEAALGLARDLACPKLYAAVESAVRRLEVSYG